MKGEELARRRETLGLNQSQAAEFLGIDRTTLVRWEKAEELPRLAAAGAATLLKPGREVNDWVCSLKPAARRGIMQRISENVSKCVEETKNEIATGPGPAILRAGLSGRVLNELAQKSGIELVKIVGLSAGGEITRYEETLLFQAELELGWITLAEIPEGEYRPGQKFHVTEIAVLPSDGTAEKAAADFKKAVLEESPEAIAARGAARPDGPAPVPDPLTGIHPLREDPDTMEYGGVKRGGPDPVRKYRRDLDPLAVSNWPASCAECSMTAEMKGGDACPGCPNYVASAPASVPIAEGPQVEKLRRTLKTMLAQFGAKGVTQLSGKTGIPADKIRGFVTDSDQLTVPQFDAIMDVLRETEGA